ncbi:MAG: chemotaxis protein CheW [Leptolyngbya sp. SIO1E4]|nr:chemotaxis protein CheW [Leptolyngbya sp. SIO1E4]
MKTSYFLFDLHQRLSAIEATYVEEVLALPELILIPDAPLNIVGILDLRGEVLPVLDLRLKKDGQSQPYQLSDSVVVLNQAELRIGIIVKDVQDIREISSEDITPELVEHQDSLNFDARNLASGMVTGEETIFILSEPKAWFNAGEIQQFISVTSFLVTEMQAKSQSNADQASDNDSSVSRAPFCPLATPEMLRVFRQRAENLRLSIEDYQIDEEIKTLVIIALNDRLFGIDSQTVREFITIRQATPIPCCPPHVIGNINLRGEILTVVDICKPLNLSLDNLSRTPKAVVLEFDNTAIGVVVDEIRDAMFLINPQDIQTVPNTDLDMKGDYVQGVASYKEQQLQILNVSTLLQGNELVVDASL